VGAGDVPHHQVGQRRGQHREQILPFDAQGQTSQAGHGQQRQTGHRQRHGPESPDRHLLDRQRKQRPVGAPHQGQHGQQGQRAWRNGGVGGRHPQARQYACCGWCADQRFRRGTPAP
ncbi:MAG: hypothetical protein ACK559_12940, partial [bacterium]